MTKDLELLNQIAAGGAFDQTTAVRALARVVTAGATSKQTPTATMDAPEAAVLEPDETAARRRKAKPEATA